MFSTRTASRRAAGPLCLNFALAVVLAGCGGGGSDEGQPGSRGSGGGTIVVDGSSTVFRISKAAQEAYAAGHPEVTVVVDNHGTGGGFGRYLQGEVDVVDASRDASETETAKAKAQGIEWTRFLVGYDGITLVVNPKNDFVKSLSVEQLRKLWSPGSAVKTWKDLDPSWPDRKIVLYSPDNDSGTFEFFTEAIVGKKSAQRDDVQQSSDDNTLVSGVAGDVDGIGYFGYAYYAANTSKLRAVPVQAGPDARPIMPSHDTVLDKSYKPLSRPLYIFVKNASLRRPEVSAFVKYYLLNIKALTEKAGYVAPTDDDKAANQKTFSSAGSGSAPAATTTGTEPSAAAAAPAAGAKPGAPAPAPSPAGK
jgi:phosphate transport system substrate-binding protein